MGGKNSKASDASKVIDGKSNAADIRGEIKTEVSELKAKYGKVPGLAVVIVGSRPDSATYVRMKRKACDEAGIVSFHKEMPDTATEAEVLEVVSEFNANPDCHGEDHGLDSSQLIYSLHDDRVLAAWEERAADEGRWAGGNFRRRVGGCASVRAFKKKKVNIVKKCSAGSKQSERRRDPAA